MDEREIEKKLKEVWDYKEKNSQSNKKLDASWEKFSSNTFSRTKPPTIYKYYAAAAVLIVILSVGSFWWFQYIPDKKNTVAHNLTIVENPSTHKKNILLPDSSIVELEPHSKIEYADNFIANRKIHLQGEAYFNVEKDKHHPFKVFCRETTTTVLGTSFTIKEDSASTISVKLYEGSIQMNIQDSTNSWLLSPGEKFVYGQNHLTIEAFRRFKDFNDEPLTSVVHYIQENYDYKVIFPDGFLNKHITLRIRQKEKLFNIVDLLAEVYNLTAHTNENLREITFK